MSDFHHGTQVIQFNGGTRVTSTISIEIVSMVFTFSFAETLLAFISYVCKKLSPGADSQTAGIHKNMFMLKFYKITKLFIIVPYRTIKIMP